MLDINNINKLYKEKGIGVNFADTESFVKIGMLSFIINTDIEVDDIAFFQSSAIRDTMANDFIYRSYTLAYPKIREIIRAN